MLSWSSNSQFPNDRSFIGTWKWDPDRHLFYTDEGLSAFFNVSPEAAVEGLPTEDFLRSLHPDDRAVVSPKFRLAAQNGLPFSESYRVRTKQDGFRQVRSYGRPFGKKSASWQYVGAILDMGQGPEERTALTTAIDHLMMARELLSSEQPTILARLVEAVLLEAGYELARHWAQEPEAIVAARRN
jgi:PAS domain-containing protein